MSDAFVPISFVADELLTSTKMNQLAADLSYFHDGTGLGDGIILTRHLGTSSNLQIPTTNLGSGAVIQKVGLGYTAGLAGTANIPYDDTPPLSTEGTQFMSLSITPKSASSVLEVEASFYGSISALGELIAALFQDAGTTSVAADSTTISSSGYLGNVRLFYKVASGSTTATTFYVRGGGSSGNTTFNGFSSGNRVLGATVKSFIKITEYMP